jgi:hypothetical protein
MKYKYYLRDTKSPRNLEKFFCLEQWPQDLIFTYASIKRGYRGQVYFIDKKVFLLRWFPSWIILVLKSRVLLLAEEPGV